MNEDKKALASNIVALFVLRGLNIILPLVTLPYVVRVLGLDVFGRISFAVAFVMFFQILVSFGFDLSATKAISLRRDHHEHVCDIFFRCTDNKSCTSRDQCNHVVIAIGFC